MYVYICIINIYNTLVSYICLSHIYGIYLYMFSMKLLFCYLCSMYKAR